MSDFEIEIASIPTRENLVAEIFYEGVQLAEISNDAGKLQIQLYKPISVDYWELSFEELMKALANAKAKLLNSFTWGDAVRVLKSAPQKYCPNEIGSVCGIYTVDDAKNDFDVPVGSLLYLVEFGSGEAIEVPERFLQLYGSHH